MPVSREPYRPLCSCRGGCVYCEVDGQPIPKDHWLLEREPVRPPFAAELRRAMKARGLNTVQLGARIGMSKSRLGDLARGKAKRPLMRTAEKMAKALDWPTLVTIAADLRRTYCLVCRRPIVQMGSRSRRFCSHRCQVTAYGQKVRGQRRGLESLARRRLTDYQDAVAAFCRQCEPEGVCRVAKCPLRALSPLPLALDAATLPLFQTEANAQPRRRGRPMLPPPTHPGEVMTKAFHDRWW